LQFIKKKVNSAKTDFESFKIAYEVGKMVFNLIDHTKFDSNSEECKFLKEENKLYCYEAAKILFESEKGYDYLKKMAWKEVTKSDVKEKYNKNKNDIEKIIQEWDIVRNIYDIIAKITHDLDISFEFENFKDKKLIIVSHQNFDNIKASLAYNIKHISENIIGDNFKYSIKTVEKMKKFQNNLSELKEIIDKFEVNQNYIENCFTRLNTIKKHEDLFLKLKKVLLFIINKRVKNVLKT